MIVQNAPETDTTRRRASSSALDDAPLAGGAATVPTWMTLREVARLTGVSRLSVDDVIALFTKWTTASEGAPASRETLPRLSRAQFAAAVERIAGPLDATDFDRTWGRKHLVVVVVVVAVAVVVVFSRVCEPW